MSDISITVYFLPLVDINDCEGVNCNEGDCIDQVAGHFCECIMGYTGDVCDGELQKV